MRISHRRDTHLALALIGMLLLAACAPASHPTVPPTTSVRLTPYRSPTPSLTPRPSALPTGSPPPSSTPTPTNTPTPFLHVLKNDDTFLGLAFRYGVSLEAIKTANPDMNPNLLSVGKSVVIPIVATSLPTSVPTSTPVPAQMGAPRCYPTADGGLWCLVLATNNHPFAMENLSAWISLVDSQGLALAGQAAILALNRLPPSASLPLVAFFQPPAPAGVTPRAVMTDSLVIPAGDTRYLTATVQIETVDILPGGLQAGIQGNVLLPAGPQPASVVWVAVVAYDAAGGVAGVRKWEAAEPLQPGGGLPFAVTVYSLGPPIARVEAVAEARP